MVSTPVLVVVLANAVAAPIAVGLAVLLEAGAIELANRGYLPSESSFAGWVLNLAPAVFAGVIVYAVAPFVVQRLAPAGLQISWIVRDALPLVVAVLFLALLVFNAPGNPDFWLFGQLLLWPLVALAAGVVTEVSIVTILRNRLGSAAA